MNIPSVDPLDSILILVLLISIASGAPHPDAPWRGFAHFLYAWFYGSLQAFSQNASKINPSLSVTQRVESSQVSDARGNVATTEKVSTRVEPAAVKAEGQQ